MFRANAAKYPMKPMRGVTVIANFGAKTSLGKVMRDFVFALKKAGIPYQTLNVGEENEFTREPGLYTEQKDFRALRYDNVVEMMRGCFPSGLPVRRHTICFWEFDSGIDGAYSHLRNEESVIAMSDFNFDYFKREFSPAPPAVHKVLCPLRFPPADLKEPSATRKKLGIAQDAFVVFFNFSIESSRKNPEGCIKAFAEAFAGDKSCVLLLKVAGAKHFPQSFEKLKDDARRLGVLEQCVIVTDYVSDRELLEMTNACDVYLSLHRGEGFGLGMAEAMMFGKTVVATDWSASQEFVDKTNAMPVSFSFVPMTLNNFDKTVYRYVKRWAEPDTQVAAKYLRMLRDDPKLRKSLGENARRSLSERFSTEQFSRSIEMLLDGEQ